MTWALVQSKSHKNGSTSSTTVAVTLDAPAGNGNLLCISVGSTDLAGPISCSDDKGNSYSLAGNHNDTGNTYSWAQYRFVPTNGPQTIIVTFSGSIPFSSILVDEFSGVAASSSSDGYSAAAQTGITATDGVSSGSITTTASGDLIYGACVNVNSNGLTTGTGFSQAQYDGSSFLTEYSVQSSAGAIAATFTNSSGGAFVSAVMAFKPAPIAIATPRQIINIGSSANDGTGDQLRTAFDKTNNNFDALYQGAGSSTGGLWNFDATSTDTSTAPVAGRFKTNSGNYRTATQIAVHGTTIQGIDRSYLLRTQLAGDIIQCQDSTNATAWCRFILQANPVDNGTWFQLNVASEVDGGVASGNNQEIIIVCTANNAGISGGGNVSNVGTPTSGQLAQWTDATHIQGIAASSLNFAPSGALSGLTLTWNSATSLTVGVGGACSDDASTQMNLTTALTRPVNTLWASGGLLDTGAIAASTWYHVFLISNPSSGAVSALISTSVATPTLPSGYTKKRRIGSIETDASSNMYQFTQLGDEFLWAANPTSWDYNNAPVTAGGLLFGLNVPSGVKVIAIIDAVLSATNVTIRLASPDATNTSSPWNLGLPIGSATISGCEYKIRTNTSGQIQVISSSELASGFFMSTIGWLDNRGK